MYTSIYFVMKFLTHANSCTTYCTFINIASSKSADTQMKDKDDTDTGSEHLIYSNLVPANWDDKKIRSLAEGKHIHNPASASW